MRRRCAPPLAEHTQGIALAQQENVGIVFTGSAPRVHRRDILDTLRRNVRERLSHVRSFGRDCLSIMRRTPGMALYLWAAVIDV